MKGFREASEPLVMQGCCVKGAQFGIVVFEVIVATLITLTMSVGLLEMTISSANALALLRIKGELQLELTQSADNFRRDVQLATSRMLNCPNNPIWVEDLDDTSPADGHSILILQVPSLAVGGGIDLANFDCVIYDHDQGGLLLRRIVEPAPGTARPLGTRIVGRRIQRNQGSSPPPLFAVDTTTQDSLQRIRLEADSTMTRGSRTYNQRLTVSVAMRH